MSTPKHRADVATVTTPWLRPRPEPKHRGLARPGDTAAAARRVRLARSVIRQEG